MKYFLVFGLVILFQVKAFAAWYPNVITAFSGSSTYCQNDPAANLSITFSTCRTGNNQASNIVVTWYSNTTNSTNGGTQVSSTGSNTGILTHTYTPETGVVGTFYYYVEISWAGGGFCNGPSPLSTSTYTPSTMAVTVNPPAPAQPGAISGSTTVAPGTSGLTYSISAVPDATDYTWTVPSGWSIDLGDGSTSIEATSGTTGGDITVTADNLCGSSSPQTLAVSIASTNCPESTSISPTGTQTLCQGDASGQLTATVTTSGGSGTPTLLYQWYYNTTNSNTVSGATILSGATNQTYTPLTTASEVGDRWFFCVGYATDNGCAQTNDDQSLASNVVQVTVNSLPTTAIAGSPQTICDGTGATLGANTPTTGTGAWSVASGPSSNLSQFSSTTSNTATFTPDGGIGEYVLRWTISNDPCTPSTSEVTITVNTIPALSIISGPGAVTTGNNYVYSIVAVPDATNYTWTVPDGGWTIDLGQGTESIDVTAGTLDGDITVYVTNSCGAGPTATKSVVIGATPNCPVSTSITPVTVQSHCQDDPASQLTAAVTTSGGSGTPTLLYQWYYNSSNNNTISGASLISGATNPGYTPLTTASELGTRYYFCVGYAADNGCGQTNTTQSLASNPVEVTVITIPATPGVIAGADNVGPSASGLVYSISAVPTATSYNWNVPAGWTINSGQGTISVSVTSGTLGQDGDITVTATNSCGTSGASAKAVTVTTAAQPPTITLGANPAICQGTTSADLPYSATTENPDQYSIDYSAAAQAEGFVDIVNASLPASPITLVVPGAAVSASYGGNLTVRNSTSGLSSGNYSISVTVIATPATPTFIFGSTSVPESTTGLAYSIVEVADATTYAWTVPTGWSITGGQGTTGIIVTSGTAGQNGDITVTAGNTCGTSAAATLAVVSETPLDHSVYGCNACHITHDALGGSLTSTFGNSNLCLSCHVSSGAASDRPFTNADKAIPGTSGNSHAWDVASVNSTYETVLTTDPQMVLRVDTDNNDNITCSTCHDQHNINTNLNYTRVLNTGDAMCKDCHSPRNVGRYIDNTSLHRGSHPVGLSYPSGNSNYNDPPSGSVTLPGAKIECSSCHQTHYANTNDGMLLRQTNDNALCTSCHTYGTHNGMSCNDCHQTHNNNKANIYMIKNTIATPNSGDKSVAFTALTGANSFADGDAIYDGICEVCHTSTKHYRNDGNASDQSHISSGGPMDGRNCTACHPHDANFAPQGCDDCHNTEAPTFGSAVHVKHKDTYDYVCNTCHIGYGSGGASEGDHPSGTIDIAFDLNGMATRNGQDAITPVFNGDKSCDNMYCHSDGRSAYRGTDGTYTWSGTTGSQTAVYATTPIWGSGTITTCMPCHSGTGNMTDPYTITTPGNDPALPPSTGSHRRGAHLSNNRELSGNGWDVVNCFWCHNTADGDDGSPIFQGTYGTSFHVDGAILFDPRSFVDGGTMVNSDVGGSFSYSLLGSKAHCGDGKTCW